MATLRVPYRSVFSRWSTINPSELAKLLMVDATTAAMRSRIEVGTLSTQNANNVTITGGSIAGLTSLGMANGTARVTAQINLGIPITNVLDYGAVGDWNGATGTDDTTAIQNAINDAIAYGRKLVVPGYDAAGNALNYRITATLNIWANSGNSEVPGFRMEGLGMPTLTWDGADGDTMLYVCGVLESRVDNLQLNGNHTTGLIGIHHTIVGTSSQRNTYRNVRVWDCGNIGIKIEQTVAAACDYITLDQCLCYNSTYNLWVAGNVRELNLIGGTYVGYEEGAANARTLYNVVLESGVVSCYDAFFGLAQTSDFYLNGPITKLAVYGGSSESPAVLTTGAGAGVGSMLAGCCIFSSFNHQQLDASEGVGTRHLHEYAIQYNVFQPLTLENCWFKGKVDIGANCSSVTSIDTQLCAWIGLAPPVWTNFTYTGTTAVLTIIRAGAITFGDAATTLSSLGLGTMAVQDDNAVAITGGSVTGITDLSVADGGTGASTAANARTNLGLGALSVLDKAYTARSDPSAYDLTQAGMTMNAAWYDWDISAIVGAASRLVYLRVSIKDDAADSVVFFRKNGDSNNFANPGVRTQVANIYNEAGVWVETDASGVIEYFVSVAAVDNINITVSKWLP